MSLIPDIDGLLKADETNVREMQKLVAGYQGLSELLNEASVLYAMECPPIDSTDLDDLRLLRDFGEDGSMAIHDIYWLKNGRFSSMEVMVIRDTLDSFASWCIPAALRCLADGRHCHPADDRDDVDTGPHPLSDLPVSDAARPQSLWPQGSGSPLGTMARRAAPAIAKVLLRQWPLPTPDFHGAAVAARRSLGAVDAAAHALVGAHRRGAGGDGRGTIEPCFGPARRSSHPAAPAASSAPAVLCHPSSARR
jgi:hypothetical protein